jgi:hypothetical protein
MYHTCEGEGKGIEADVGEERGRKEGTDQIGLSGNSSYFIVEATGSNLGLDPASPD